MYTKSHPDLAWEKFILSADHIGFDEHIGVNKIWKTYAPDRYYEDESIIADIDPHFRKYRLISPYSNHRNQVFLFSYGRLFRHYASRAGSSRDEFMYIHFQKRKFPSNDLPKNMECFYISPLGFTDVNSGELPQEAADRLNGVGYSPSEIGYLVRQKAKLLLRGELHGPRTRSSRMRR
jgi:hypothetical protein